MEEIIIKYNTLKVVNFDPAEKYVSWSQRNLK